MAKFSIPSFDEASKADKKVDELELVKIEKQEQIDAQIRTLKVKLAKAKKSFKDSITNPRIDTIALAVEIQMMENELSFSEEIRTGIFG